MRALYIISIILTFFFIFIMAAGTIGTKEERNRYYDRVYSSDYSYDSYEYGDPDALPVADLNPPAGVIGGALTGAPVFSPATADSGSASPPPSEPTPPSEPAPPPEPTSPPSGTEA